MDTWAGAYASPRPSMDTIYQAQYAADVRRHEQARGDAMWAAARDPLATGVVPSPSYASTFAPAGSGGDQAPAPEQLTHNNMVPFFRGSVTQNTDVDRGHGARLEAFTGARDRFLRREEQPAFFEPMAHLTHTHGAPNANDLQKSRVAVSATQRNYFPVDPTYVAPGLNAGFAALGDGGNQQAATLEFVRPKTIDQLRAANDPKTVYEQRLAAPPRLGERGASAGHLGALAKNRPDTAFEQTPDHWLRTTGAVQKPTNRTAPNVKPTARAAHAAYVGAAGDARTRASDYGKAGICVYDNARHQTVTRTSVSNLRSLVNAVVAPLLDVLRATPKEYAIEAGRTFGNMHAQVPEKATLYDPVDHVMRTTIKETTVHDTDVSNLRGAAKATLPYDDALRTTVKETTPTVDTVRNVAARTYRVTVYNTDEVARRTHREMLVDAVNPAGHVGTGAVSKAGAYVATDIELPPTQKQFVSDAPHTGGAGAQADFRPMSHEAADAMEIDGTREMLMAKAGYTPNAAGANAGVDGSDVTLDVRKLEADRQAARAFGNTAVTQAARTAPVDGCELTKQPAQLANYSAARLDPAVLASLASNPYQIGINPIADC